MNSGSGGKTVVNMEDDNDEMWNRLFDLPDMDPDRSTEWSEDPSASAPKTVQATQEWFGTGQRQEAQPCATNVSAMRYGRTQVSQTSRRGIPRHETTRIVLDIDVQTCVYTCLEITVFVRIKTVEYAFCTAALYEYS